MLRPIIFNALFSLNFLLSSLFLFPNLALTKITPLKKPNVIYGTTDDRVKYEKAKPTEQSYLKATGLLIDTQDVIYLSATKQYIITVRDLNFSKEPFCPEALKAGHMSVGFCSGFLVDKDLFVTAGHCYEAPVTKITNYVLFNYYQGNPQHQLITKTIGSKKKILKLIVPESDMFMIQSTEDFALDENDLTDHWITRLDRPVLNVEPLKINTKDTLQENDSVFVVGYPYGLPATITPNGLVKNTTISQTHQFITNLDTFSGNSGSAVLNQKTNLVEGILIEGEDDFVFNNKLGCIEYKTCENFSDCIGESVTKITSIPYLMQHFSNK